MNWGALIIGTIMLVSLRAYADRWLGSVVLLLGLIMVLANLGVAGLFADSSQEWIRYAMLRDQTSFGRSGVLAASYAFIVSGLLSFILDAINKRVQSRVKRNEDTGL